MRSRVTPNSRPISSRLRRIAAV
jgi:hypothetical protein